MTQLDESLTLTIPRDLAREIPTLASDLNDRMHELLERNTDGALSATERAQLEDLVKMSQFAQILAMALRGTPA